MGKIAGSKVKLLACLSLVCTSWVTGCVQQKPPRALSHDEKALWSFLSTRRPTELQKREALVVLSGLQSVGARYAPCSADQKESLHLETLRLSPSDVRMHLPIVVCGMCDGKPCIPEVWLDALSAPSRLGAAVEDVVLIYSPSREVVDETAGICDEIVKDVYRRLADLKAEHPQLLQFDEACFKSSFPARGWPARELPAIHYQYGYSYSNDAVKVAETEHWCEVVLLFGSEQLSQWALDYNRHWLFPRQGLYARWGARSQNERLNHEIEQLIRDRLTPLMRYEEQLGGTVIEEPTIMAF